MHTSQTPLTKQGENEQHLPLDLWLEELCYTKFEQLMHRLREEFSALPGRPDATEAVAFLSHLNKAKNRYIDIPCLDKTRVKLQDQKTDYIHANWVECPEFNVRFIMCQAPIAATVADFYQMLYQEQVTLIACMTRVTENGIDKSYPYWPVVEGSQTVFDKFTLKALSTHAEHHCQITELELTKQDGKCSQRTTHILYTDWSDHRAPNCTHKFLELVNLCTRKLNELSANSTAATAVIHCSAGIGRSGTLAVLLRLLKEIENGQVPSIPSVVRQLRQQRALAVQGIEQYTFIYRAIMEMIYKLESGPRQPKGDLLKHLNALRSMTTKSTCDLRMDMVKHPKGGYTFFPGIGSDGKRSPTKVHQPFGMIKQRARKLKHSFLGIKKRISARISNKGNANRSSEDHIPVAKSKEDNKGLPKGGNPLKKSGVIIESPVSKRSASPEHSDQKVNTTTEQKNTPETEQTGRNTPVPGGKDDKQKNK
uniref:Tyrosine-protein phosphatase domain-containing protein n=1 Tax=Trichuris muris TaxID=70415 RepID=A0A5S6QWN0_TRIMR